MPRPDPQDPTLWVQTATPEQQGSFCDRDSEIHYRNVNDFEKERTVSDAIASSITPCIVDATADPEDSFSPDQRWNLNTTEKDSQGLDTPIKYGPGR